MVMAIGLVQGVFGFLILVMKFILALVAQHRLVLELVHLAICLKSQGLCIQRVI